MAYLRKGTAFYPSTVTAGNLNNTGIVYPTGHVIQTAFTPLSAYYAGAVTGSSLSAFLTGSEYDRALDSELPQASLTTVKANSKILIICCLANAHVGDGAPYANMHFERIKDGTPEALVKTGEIYGLARFGPGDEKSVTTIFMDEPDDPAGTVLKYGQVFWIANTGVMNIGGGSSWSSMTLMEIAA